MNIIRRITRYLILWSILFVILCVISVIRYWDDFVRVLSVTFSSYLALAIYGVFIVALFIWGFRAMFRSLR